jgi:sugar transferase (PEP-CTERM/EpsH1 system associated)
VRVHGEHGRDVDDLDGNSRKHQWLRRLYRPFVSRYVALSSELSRYLVDNVGVPRYRVTLLCNGVDAQRFHPAPGGRAPIPGCPFTDPTLWVVGTVGRMQGVKDQVGLARAFVRALELEPALRNRLRLVMVGDGPLRAQSLAVLDVAGMSDLAWLPGARDDVPQVMRGLDCFVLPSLAEGISNTILEAMASGLPVLATDVGGNAELVTAGQTGELVPAGDPTALAQHLVVLAGDPLRAAALGRAGRVEVERRFSLQAMVAGYRALYDGELERERSRRARQPA